MANVDAFNEGFDAGMGKKKPKSKKKDNNAYSVPQYFKHGGKVKKTGMGKVHRGEVVLTAAQAKKLTNKKKLNRKRIRNKR